ncbi:prephenate dehydrogenase/arogenate dehydrogenase family protein [Butyrivibrio sp. MB2005]|uniref:prephenate dehydrogenase/arogenate dehydrogenase family protein n=1 Tax=Butyrivibrio sp. MB2005 TaxID=1280678 RepID=UPI000423663C
MNANDITCGFIGLGLIGGSMARALKEKAPGMRIVSYTPHRETSERAKADGIVDEIAPAIDEHFTGCDYIFLCAPIERNNDNLSLLKPFLDKKTTLSDIGSVKTSIHEHVKELDLEDQFIGGHPMAGTERIGYINSKASILENAYYILTKTEKTSDERLENYRELVELMGATPLIIPYEQHDFATAAISHVPHVISGCLVNLVERSDYSDGLMKTIAAGGFKDITRISSSSPVMLQQICLTNRKNIVTLLNRYISYIKEMKDVIDAADGDGLMEFFSSAREYRDSFNDLNRGPIRKTYITRVDIADEPGNIASVATLLSVNGINIKNIGIVHNREDEHGTLSIEFHDGKAMEKAVQLLDNHGYPSAK